MLSPPKHPNEVKRIQALQACGLLDTPPEERFDRLTRLAKHMFGVPIALVCLVDENRQWFKSRQGLDASETERNISFCGHAILDEEILEIENASQDPRFSDNPLVTGAPYIQFYAGASINTLEGYPIGTLCIIDTKPRKLTANDLTALADLAHCVSSEISSKAEKALLTERRRLSEIIEGTRIGTWEWNIETGKTVFNERWAEIVGYTLEELQPTNIDTWLSLAHPDDLDVSGKALELCFNKTLNYYDVEARMKHKDGHWVWVHDRGKVVKWTHEGKPSIMSGTHADITEKKRAEQALQEHTDFQKLIFENLPALLFVKDKDFRIVTANKNFLSIYPEGIRNTIIGRTTVEEFNQREADEFLKEDRKAFSEGYSETEETLTFPSGERKTLWTKKIRFHNAEGEPFILGVATDITYKKQEAAQREELRTRLTLATTAAKIGIWVWDIEKNELEWDDQMFTLYGVNRDQFSGAYSAWQQGLHPEDSESSEQAINDAIEGKQEFNTTFRVVRPNGDIHHIQAAAHVERDIDGKPLRMIGTNSDVTTQKLAEQALIRAKTEAELNARAKSQFVANVSHEIRTPINGVIGMINLVLKQTADKEQKRRLKLAQFSATTLLTVINDILDFSKIEAGKLEIVSLEFDILQLLSETAEANALAAHSKDLEFIIDAVQVDERIVKGDPNRLKQIINNLLSNAIKFTSEGTISLTAKLNSLASDKLKLTCSIQDSGIGISKENLNRLFDPFTQADATTTRNFGGTGLGLSIVKNLCHMMGGQIDVQSEPGLGSCFTFSVCLETTKTKIHTDASSHNLNILVLEPQEPSREIISRQLQTWGHHVNIATSWDDLDSMSKEKGFVMPQLAYISQDLLPKDIEQAKSFIEQDALKIACKVLIVKNMERIDGLNLQKLSMHSCFSRPATPSDLFHSIVLYAEIFNKEAPTKNYAADYCIKPNCNILIKNKRVLLVEDNLINQEVAGTMLEDNGLLVVTAIHGREALNTLSSNKENPFDLILMDCQMPELDGYQTTRAIRAGEAGEVYKQIPIIALTANSMKGDAEKCKQAGMNSHLAKPIDESLLINEICRFLSSNEKHQTQIPETPEPIENNDVSENTLATWRSDELLKRMKGKKERTIKLLQIFIDQNQQRIDELKELQKSLNLDETIHFSHAIKGVARNLSCDKLADTAYRVENAAKENHTQSLPALLAQFECDFKEVTEEFKKYLR